MFWILMAILGGGLALLVWNDDAGSVLGMDSGSFARLVVLGSLVLALSAGIVRMRGSAPGMLRIAAAWLAIALVLVAGYQYRYELQDIASRLTAGLVPGSPLSMRFDDGTEGVRIDRLPNGHFAVRGQVNDAAVDFMVDTGATTSVLTIADAVAAGYDAETLSFTIPVSTANGVAQAARLTADTITIGSITRSRVPVLVARDGMLDQSLLGMNFIGTLSGFEMRGDRLLLRD